MAMAVISISGFFSKRAEDSVRSPSPTAVRLTLVGLKCAASRIRFVVDSSTSTRAPPKMPAITLGPAGSVMRSVSSGSRRVTPSSVVSVSPLVSPAHDDLVAGDLVIVEGVQRLAQAPA